MGHVRRTGGIRRRLLCFLLAFVLLPAQSMIAFAAEDLNREQQDAGVQTDDFETLKLQLEHANAFSDSEEDILRF